MPRRLGRFLLAILLAILAVGEGRSADQLAGPLPSWNDRPVKQAILRFVERVVDVNGEHYVPPEDRIATFDNDGTLWAEQPMYFQLAFTLDRVKVVGKDTEWREKQPLKGILSGDFKAAFRDSKKTAVESLTMATHIGMTTVEFEQIVNGWLATARHPKFERPYTDLVYQPMLELLDYLRLNGFKTYIVSGGGVEFLRVFAERVYGIPPHQVIGSSIKLKYEWRDGNPVLVRQAEIDFIDDKAGKPVGIHKFIGRRPIAAFGNSDGDLEMLQWTTTGPGLRFGLIVHHTDDEREFAYDRKSLVGRLDDALEDAPKRGWHVVDMKQDWKVIFPFEK